MSGVKDNGTTSFFIINHDELILDQVLVEYNEDPIFFVCKHEQDYYIVSCTDMEKDIL